MPGLRLFRKACPFPMAVGSSEGNQRPPPQPEHYPCMAILPGSLPKAREYLLILKKRVKSRCMSLLFHPAVLFRPAARKDGESCWFCSRAWPTSRFIISFYGHGLPDGRPSSG